jgi:NTE family protein
MGNSFSGVSVDGRFFPAARIPGYVGLKLAYSNKNYSQSQSLFYEDLVPAFIKKRERFVKLRYGFPLMQRSKIDFFAGLAMLTDFYYQTPVFTDLDFDVTKYNLFNTGARFERNSLDYRQYPTKGRQQLLIAQYITGKEQYRPGGRKYFTNIRKHEWFLVKGSWQNFPTMKKRFTLGLMGEAVYSTKTPSSNYTATVLRASAFTPTPHSKIAFNEAFHADSYVAAGIVPVIKLNDMFHFRMEAYGFVPLREIRKEQIGEKPTVYYRAKYGDLFRSYQYMGEAALVLQLPFVSVSLFVNGYSYPKSNYNAGLNIGYLIFDSGFLD